MILPQLRERCVRLHEHIRRDLYIKLLLQVPHALGFALPAAIGEEDERDRFALEVRESFAGAGNGG